MLRDHSLLATLIASGKIQINHSTPCTTQGCENPLLSPIAFNPTSKLDGQYLCDACDGWEWTHQTKCPA
jgi:hypothetical protein